jgi:hypothetical protein
MMIVEKLVEWRLAGETEVLGENLPQRHFVHHKFHMTRPGFELGPPRLNCAFYCFSVVTKPVYRAVTLDGDISNLRSGRARFKSWLG